MIVLAAAGLMLTAAGCGGGEDGEPRDPFADAKQRVLALDPGRAAAPRWELVARLEGTGEETEILAISRRAIQWRVRWRCSSGQMTLSIAHRARLAGARRQGRCPKRATTSSIQTGAVRVTVAATGRWSAVVEQQVDTDLHEPPLRAMRAPGARVLASGRFYAIQQSIDGQGEALLYRLPDGRLALRLEGFRTAANTDLFVRLSKSRTPRTTKRSAGTPEVRLARLKSTVGDQNYVLPRQLDRGAVGSVVIWNEPVQTAYTAATLRRP